MPKTKREVLLGKLECVVFGLSDREVLEQSNCFVFKDRRVYTFNDELACSMETGLDLEGAVSSKELIELLRKMPEESVLLEITKKGLRVKGSNREAYVRMEEKVVLQYESVEKPKSWEKLPGDFCEAIGIVQHSAGKDESQFASTCVHIHPKWVEAFDSFQISRYRLQTNISKPSLVRRDSIKHLASLDVTHISETKSWLHFRNDDGLVISVRQFVDDVTFPKLSANLKVRGELVKLPKDLSSAADRAAVFSSQNTEENMITVQLLRGKVRVFGVGAGGEYKEWSRKTSYEGPPLRFTIPPDNLRSLVNQDNEVEIADGRLRVNGGKFVYVLALGESGEE